MTVKTYKKASPYYNTPQTSWYLSYYQGVPLGKDISDINLVVDSRYQHRPDILSFDLYGTPDYWWTFSVLNPDIIIDPIYDLKGNTNIYYATKDRLSRMV
jgi:hypothetical protein